MIKIARQYILKCQLVAIDAGGNEAAIVAAATSACSSSDFENMLRVMAEMSEVADNSMESEIDDAVMYPYEAPEDDEALAKKEGE